MPVLKEKKTKNKGPWERHLKNTKTEAIPGISKRPGLPEILTAVFASGNRALGLQKPKSWRRTKALAHWRCEWRVEGVEKVEHLRTLLGLKYSRTWLSWCDLLTFTKINDNSTSFFATLSTFATLEAIHCLFQTTELFMVPLSAGPGKRLAAQKLLQNSGNV